MTRAMRASALRVSGTASGPRWLRFALVRDGRVEHEETVPPERTITLGEAGDVPATGPQRTLLSHSGGAWMVAADEAVTGQSDAGPLDGTRAVRLGPSGRARLALAGGAAVLVQVVDRPIERRPAPLPPGLVGGLLSGTDWWFTSFVAVSFCLHLGVIAYLLDADWPVESALVPVRFATTIFIEPPPPDERRTPEVESDTESVADRAADDARDGEPGEPSDRADPHERSERHADARRPPSARPTAPSLDPDAIARSVVEQLLLGTSRGPSLASAFDALRDGAATERSAEVFDVVEGTAVASSDPGVLRPRDGRESSESATRDLGQLARRPGDGMARQPEGRPIREVEVVRPANAPRPIFGTPEPGDPDFQVAELIQRLRGRMPAVQRCYDHALTHESPTLAGRITLSMQVMPPGHLAGVRAADNSTGSEALGACIVRAVQTVRVTRGPERPVTVDFPIVLARQG
ncbi:MAG: AgmX/PglI C-terminal domain-containing protein [Sandaracinaceae bacterium]|nr:AgmX/PglI C-terminal domain-containing protein [Sandaracinaceae bacterium]